MNWTEGFDRGQPHPDRLILEWDNGFRLVFAADDAIDIVGEVARRLKLDDDVVLHHFAVSIAALVNTAASEPAP